MSGVSKASGKATNGSGSAHVNGRETSNHTGIGESTTDDLQYAIRTYMLDKEKYSLEPSNSTPKEIERKRQVELEQKVKAIEEKL